MGACNVRGGVALDTTLGVAVDGDDGTVILVTLNHLGAPEQHIDQPSLQSKLSGINLSSLGDGDNIEKVFSHPLSWALTSVHKAQTAISEFKDRRTVCVFGKC